MGKKIITIFLAMLISTAAYAYTSVRFVCNMPSSAAVQVRVYDVTGASETVAWTATGVSERAVGLSKSCYYYTATLTAGSAYQIDWRDSGTPTKVASETIANTDSWLDAALSSRPTLSQIEASTVLAKWDTALPGAFGAGTAGYILGTIPSGVAVIPSVLSAGVLQLAATSLGTAPVSITRGDAKTLTFNLGTGWPLGGKKVYFIAKKDRLAANSTAIVNRETTITDAVNGVSTIDLTSAETAAVGYYYAEVEVRDADDTNARTARQFILSIAQDVRQ